MMMRDGAGRSYDPRTQKYSGASPDSDVCSSAWDAFLSPFIAQACAGLSPARWNAADGEKQRNVGPTLDAAQMNQFLQRVALSA